MCWKKFHGVADAFGMCLCDKDAVAPVMFGGMADIPAVDAMRGPRLSFTGGLVQDDFGAKGRHWCTIKIKCTVEVCFSG